MRDSVEILINRRKEIDEEVKKLQAEYKAIGEILQDYLDRRIGVKRDDDNERM